MLVKEGEGVSAGVRLEASQDSEFMRAVSALVAAHA